jgi:hypothetical protein
MLGLSVGKENTAVLVTAKADAMLAPLMVVSTMKEFQATFPVPSS